MNREGNKGFHMTVAMKKKKAVSHHHHLLGFASHSVLPTHSNRRRKRSRKMPNLMPLHPRRRSVAAQRSQPTKKMKTTMSPHLPRRRPGSLPKSPRRSKKTKTTPKKTRKSPSRQPKRGLHPDPRRQHLQSLRTNRNRPQRLRRAKVPQGRRKQTWTVPTTAM